MQKKLQRFIESKWPTIIWFAVGLLSVIAKLIQGKHQLNNFYIFKGIFWHSIAQSNLYVQYPAEYFDANHYGPVFALVIAPFAVLPVWLGAVLWTLLNCFVLYKAVRLLPITIGKQNLVLMIALVEMATAAQGLQFNAAIAAAIIGTYVCVKNGNEFWAALFIVLGFYVKLYPIVGLVFWLMSNHKLKFIGYGLFWLAVLFVLPMVISSPQFVVQSYTDWYNSLLAKNIENVTFTGNSMQDISVMGMIKRIFNAHQIANLTVIAPALLLFVLTLLNFKKYINLQYQLLLLSSVLLFVVLFSTGSESPTYIIALMGVAIWFVHTQTKISTWQIALLVFVLLFTSLSATDIVPSYLKRNFIRPYALKALPCFLVWLAIVYQMIRINSKTSNITNEQ